MKLNLSRKPSTKVTPVSTPAEAGDPVIERLASGFSKAPRQTQTWDYLEAVEADILNAALEDA